MALSGRECRIQLGTRLAQRLQGFPDRGRRRAIESRGFCVAAIDAGAVGFGGGHAETSSFTQSPWIYTSGHYS